VGVDESQSTNFEPNDARSEAPDLPEIVDAPGSLPERRPLRQQVVRSLAAPDPPPRPVVVRRAPAADTKKSSDLPRESVVAVAVIAAIIGGLSFLRPDLITTLTSGDTAVVHTPVGAPATPASSMSTGLPRRGPSRVDWGDGYHHMVVTAAVPGAVTRTDVPEPAAQPEQVSTRPGSTRIERADGTVSTVDVPDESLELAVPNREEAAALRTLGAASVTSPIVVVDTDGVIGEPMTRYIQVDGRLVEPPAVTPQEPTTPPVAEVAEVSEADLMASLLALPDVVEVTRLAPGLLAVASTEVLEDLAAQPGVLTVGDDVLLGLAALPGTTSPSGRTASQPAPTPLPAGGRRPVVAVIDTGFDASSSELAAAWWRNDDEQCDNGLDDDGNGYTDDCRGWDFGDDDTDPAPEPGDPHGDHGTEVTSIIAATRNGSGVVGVASGATIMPLKVMRPTGVIPMSSVAAAVDYAVANGADVVNLSLVTQPGVDREQMRILEAAIDRAGAAGVVVVTGAGNDGRNLLLTPAWPASLGADRHHVLTVGALGRDGAPASFSNQGRAVTFAAPGTAIPVAGCAAGTVWRSGSSYAAPIVTGLVASVIAEQAPADLDALLAAVVERTELVDGLYVVSSGPVVDAPSASPGGLAPADPTCRPSGS
jgi:subtilisin family serine protease